MVSKVGTSRCIGWSEWLTRTGPRRQSPSSLAQSSITQPIKKRKNVTSRSRGQGRRYHGEVQESADGSFIFRATGADNWGKLLPKFTT